MERWKTISADTLHAFKDKETGMINEFALMYAKRKQFPLHYFVFRHNVEQIFSLGGRLSDPNMIPSYLATLVLIGSNEKLFMPAKNDIFQRYLRSICTSSRSRANCSRPTSAWRWK